MKNILLATDLAAETNRAFDRSINLASTLAAKLHIIHVCPLYTFPKNTKQTISLKQDAEDMIKNSLNAHTEIKTLRTSVTVVEGGETFAEIINHAEKIKADLIVMGMHGKLKLLDMFVGTTVERVIRKGMKPVLMVTDKPLHDYKNVLIGMDFSAGAKQVFHLAIELAPKSAFHLIHSYDFPLIGDYMAQYAEKSLANNAMEDLDKFVKKNKKVLKKNKVSIENFHFETVKGEAYSSLTNKAAEVQAELIAIGTHSHVSLMPYKVGGTARDILVTPPCDVLVAKGL